MEKRKKGYKKKVFGLAVCILLGAAGQDWMLSKQIYAAQKGTYASIGVPIEEVPIKGAIIEEVSIEEASIEEAPIEEALMEKVSIEGTSIGEAYSEGKEPHFKEGFLEAQEN